MRNLLRSIIGLLLALGAWGAPAAPADDAEASADPDAAASLDTTADRFFGQSSFSNNNPNSGGISASGLNQPKAVVLDLHGNLYVADNANNRVLEFNAPLTNRVADRVFGQPDFSHNTANNGGITASSLDSPYGVALDAQGNLYVVDTANNRVLEYDAPLTSDRVADRVFGQPDFAHGAANNGGVSAMSLAQPVGVALDAAGNLYVGDNLNHRVLVYEAPLYTHKAANHVFGQAGSFTAHASNNGGISAASLSAPEAMALDGAGNLYVADTGNHRVLGYFTPLTSGTTADRVFGQPDFTHATINLGVSAVGLLSPTDLALDAAGNLYVADFNDNRVLEYAAPLSNHQAAARVFGQGGSFTTRTVNKGGVSADSLSEPGGLALDAAGNLFVADSSNSRVLDYDLPVPHGLPSLANLGPNVVAGGSAAFVLTANGAGFVLSSQVVFNGSPRPTTFINSTQLTAAIPAADLVAGGPFAVTVSTPAPGGGSSILLNLPLYTRASQDTTADVVQGQPNFRTNQANSPRLPAAGRLAAPAGLAVDTVHGRLFAADPANNRVLSWPNLPAFANGQPADIVLGQPNLLATLANNGGRSARSLFSPTGVAVDAAGNLYVADTFNNRVLEYDAPLSSGMAASRVIGQGGSFTNGLSNNGGLSANSLAGPLGMALDAAGNLFVADGSNHRVLEYFTPRASGPTADRVFGQPDFTHNPANNGGVSAQSLSVPRGLALDTAGNLYVADRSNNRVLAYAAPLSNHQAAVRVFGQGGSFTSASANKGGLGAGSLSGPDDVAVDVNGNLYVADFSNNRLLEFDQPLTTDAVADRVLGQGGSFITATANKGGLSADSLLSPEGVALDARSNVYVADSVNSRVLEYAWVVPVTILALPLVLRP